MTHNECKHPIRFGLLSRRRDRSLLLNMTESMVFVSHKPCRRTWEGVVRMFGAACSGDCYTTSHSDVP